MGFFDTLKGTFDMLKETFRDKTRDDICAALRSLGIDAQMAKRGLGKKWIGLRDFSLGSSGESLGLIDILQGPIRWVNVLKYQTHSGEGSRGYTYYFTDYGVHDPRLGPNSLRPEIKICVKQFLLFDPVVDLRWEGDDFGLGIVDRLNSDVSIMSLIMQMSDLDVKIHAHHRHRCWIISTKTNDAPSKELWDCYQAIARHLLAEWPRS